MKKLLVIMALSALLACSPRGPEVGISGKGESADPSPEITDVSFNRDQMAISVYDAQGDFKALNMEYQDQGGMVITENYMEFPPSPFKETTYIFTIDRPDILLITPEDKAGNVGETWIR